MARRGDNEFEAGDDGLFQQWFSALRERLPKVGGGLGRKVTAQIERLEGEGRLRAPPADRIVGSFFKDVLNIVSRWFRGGR